MALYPAVPANRLAYDMDGTSVIHYDNANTPTELTTVQKQKLNDETSEPVLSFANPSIDKVSFVFPVKYDIAGLFHSDAMSGSSVADSRGYWRYSLNTTNGNDGTWTDVPTTHTVDGVTVSTTTTVDEARGSTNPAYRSKIFVTALTGVKGVQYIVGTGYFGGVSLYTCHIYGTLATGESHKSLEIWQETTDARVSGSALDWQDVSTGASYIKSFRVHNPTTSSAINISLSIEGLTNSSPSYVAMQTFSLNGFTWTPTLNIGSLGPGETSDVVQIMLSVPADAQTGLWASRIKAAAMTFIG